MTISSSSKVTPDAQSEAAEGEMLNVCKLNTYQFCTRRFYLECVQGEFNSNAHTEMGNDVHRRVDTKHRNYLSSETLGLCGILDKIDPEEDVPVEYKKGHPPDRYKNQEAWLNEAIQVCAQGLLLEENIGQPVTYGYLYYDGIKRRVRVDFDETLRLKTLQTIHACRELLRSTKSPPPLLDSPKCGGCSVLEACSPYEINALNGETSNHYKRRCLVPLEEGAILYISQPGSALRKSDDALVVTTPEDKKQTVGIHRIRQVWINQPTSLSSSALEMCLFHKIPLLFHSRNGKYLGQLVGPFNKNIFLRRAQFKSFEDSSACLALAKELVRSKIRNQRVFLGRNLPEKSETLLDSLKKLEKSIEETLSLDSLLGYEGASAALYFQTFPQLLKNREFAFATRRRRPAPDPVNALLSFGYAILGGECISALSATGFDPYFGFYHQSRYGRPALALDLMEPLRPVIVDSLIITLLNKRQLSPDDFNWEGQRCVLSEKGRAIFFHAWRERLDTEATHPLFGYKLPYRRLIALEARILAAYLLGEIPKYQPFTWR
jgi:CRISPR-associated endonuclease Cas1/CRISPR-associated protein Cas4